MLLLPNVPENYRRWAYCSAIVRRCSVYRDTYAAGKPGSYIENMRVHMDKKWDSAGAFKKKAARLTRRIARYAALRDKLAATLDNPEKYLLSPDEMINMPGEVIIFVRKRRGNPDYLLLTHCSSDGKTVYGFDDENLDALELLAHGYGKHL